MASNPHDVYIEESPRSLPQMREEVAHHDVCGRSAAMRDEFNDVLRVGVDDNGVPTSNFDPSVSICACRNSRVSITACISAVLFDKIYAPTYVIAATVRSRLVITFPRRMP